jgi:polysaccharide export outer membrane protein
MLRLLAVLLSVFALTACQGGPVASGTALAQREPGSASTYVLGPRDKIRVSVFGQPNISGEFTLDGDGAFAMPLIGQVRAGEQTAQQLSQTVADRLRGRILLSPDVQVAVLTFRPYYILGEVVKPGEYPYSDGLTVLNAVAAAQGYTSRGDRSRIFIRREGESTEVAYAMRSLVSVHPGDTLRVPERWF